METSTTILQIKQFTSVVPLAKPQDHTDKSHP